MYDQKTHIYLNPVAADRAEEFERFLLEVAAPAVRAQRPELADRWQLLRAVTPEPEDSSVVTYVMIFDGGELEQDWELDKLLPAHYGSEEAERLAGPWLDSFVPLRQWLDALAARDGQDPQVGWTFTPVGARTLG